MVIFRGIIHICPYLSFIHTYTFYRGKNEDNLKTIERSNIRARLGKRTIINEGEKVKENMDHDLFDEEKVLDRNELEKLRYANLFVGNSWDTNPENVPRGNYFEVCSLINIINKIYTIFKLINLI